MVCTLKQFGGRTTSNNGGSFNRNHEQCFCVRNAEAGGSVMHCGTRCSRDRGRYLWTGRSSVCSSWPARGFGGWLLGHEQSNVNVRRNWFRFCFLFFPNEVKLLIDLRTEHVAGDVRVAGDNNGSGGSSKEALPMQSIVLSPGVTSVHLFYLFKAIIRHHHDRHNPNTILDPPSRPAAQPSSSSSHRCAF